MVGKKVKANALKKAKAKRTSGRGRTTKYDGTFPLRAQDYARQGMIDTAIAKKLGIALSTYYQYQIDYTEFSEAIKKGKMPVDIEVENALLKRAQGFEYEEVHVEYKPKGKEKSDEKTKPTMIKKIKKLIVPDVCAQIFWLKNRRPGLWRDKHDLALSGGMSITVVSAVPRPKKKEGNKK